MTDTPTVLPPYRDADGTIIHDADHTAMTMELRPQADGSCDVVLIEGEDAWTTFSIHASHRQAAAEVILGRPIMREWTREELARHLFMCDNHNAPDPAAEWEQAPDKYREPYRVMADAILPGGAR